MSNVDAGVPSPAELAAAIDGLERSRDAVLACCTGLSADAWTHSQGPGRWSPAQTLEHLLLFETLYMTGPEGLVTVMAQPPTPDWEAQTANKEAAIAGAATVQKPLAAPEPMQPQGAIAPAELLAQWTAARAATLAVAQRPGQALKSHTRPHVRMGTISAYQVLLYMAAHTDRHRQQIERCLAAPAPRS